MGAAITRFFKFICSIKHGFWLFGYAVMGIIFQVVEKVVYRADIMISCSLDDKIPFISAFILPYIFWFWYIAAILAVLVLKDKSNMYRCCASIYIGMILCFIFYLLYPHGQPLRVDIPADTKNIFDRLVYYIYSHDTNTNTFPSIHVLNSMAVNFALQISPFFRDKIFIRIASHVMNILIIASTVLVKQHSILDIIAALILAYIIRFAIYSINYKKIFAKKTPNTETV